MMSDDQAVALATRASEEWGGLRHPPRLIGNRENAVLETVLADGSHVALRLHRPGYQTNDAIRSELTWMMMLASKRFRCCYPVPTLSGALIAKVGGRAVSAVRWLYGTPIGAAGVGLPGNQQQQVALFQAVGRMMGDLHNTTDSLSLPRDFVRPYWDEDGLLGEEPFWNRFWENPVLSDTEQYLILDARELALAKLIEFRHAGADFGLIHADVLRENVLMDEAGLALIDFDDCGFGFRMYELGGAMSQNLREPFADDIAVAMIGGYRERRALPDHAAELLPMFVMLRAFASLGWVMSRRLADNPVHRDFADRAIKCAREFVQGENRL